MSTAPTAHSSESPRSLVAGEVRAWLARENIRVAELARRTGRDQMYWQRRLKPPESVPLDVEDLAAVADVVGVDVADFFSATARSPRSRVNENGGDEGARPKGLEPPTFWLGAFLGEDELADVVDLAERRAPAPARGWESESLAPVLDLTARVDERAS